MKPDAFTPASDLLLRGSGIVAIVSARWHVDIVSKLIEGAGAAFNKHTQGWKEPEQYVAPGSYEIPQLVHALATKKTNGNNKYDAIVALGCLIRGETAHFDLIATTVFKALDEIGRQTGVAISNGILTAENKDQALARAGGKVGNKGEEAMLAALSLCETLRKLKP